MQTDTAAQSEPVKPAKVPVTRRGQSKPYRKPTAQVLAERIDAVANMMARLCTRSQIHKYAVQQGWEIHWNSVDRYMVRARKLLAERSQMTKEQARGICLNVLLGVINTGSPRERIAAEARLAEIFGINAPARSEISGPEGAPIAVAEKVVILELPALDDQPARDQADVEAWRREHGQDWLAERGGVKGNGGNGHAQEPGFTAQDGAVSGNGGNGHNGHG